MGRKFHESQLEAGWRLMFKAALAILEERFPTHQERRVLFAHLIARRYEPFPDNGIAKLMICTVLLELCKKITNIVVDDDITEFFHTHLGKEQLAEILATEEFQILEQPNSKDLSYRLVRRNVDMEEISEEIRLREQSKLDRTIQDRASKANFN